LVVTESPPYTDQTVINKLISHDDKFKIKYDFLPSEVYIWGNGKPQSQRVAFHHAVAADDKVVCAQDLGTLNKLNIVSLGVEASFSLKNLLN
jgi:hypothetical protein